MVAKKITSLQHPLVKHWFELRTCRTYREKNQSLLVSGKKMIQELPLLRKMALEDDPSLVAEESFLVTDAILKKITGLVTPDGIAAEVALPPPQPLQTKQKVLILDEILDPGNLGTLLRSAWGLNWDGVALTPHTVDLFNDKVLRSGKGAQFHLPYAIVSPDAFVEWPHTFYAADLEGEPIEQQWIAKTSFPLALILSHEGQGCRSWAKKMAKKVTIPMNPQTESLNVASSGAILLYLLGHPR